MDHFFSDLSVIIIGSALLGFLAILCRQPVILAYIACGALAGPAGFGLVRNVQLVEDVAHLGITLLLFLAGLYLHPQKLLGQLVKSSIVTGVSSALAFGTGFGLALLFGFSLLDSLIIAMAMMFSSTILVIKLLPTTELHHRRLGEVCISVLILQDLLAVAVLAFIRCLSAGDQAVARFAFLSAELAVFICALVLLEYYILRRVMQKVELFHEALFILGLAWCFGMAWIAGRIGLSHETGAFFAGVVLARHNIARFISEKLKPLRDFFLVLFFFTLGAGLRLSYLMDLWLPTAVFVLVFVFVKALMFERIYRISGERPAASREAGLRLGQLSEFGLLIALLALQDGHLTARGAQMIQFTVIISFIASSYYVFYSYPTPIGVPGESMRD